MTDIELALRRLGTLPVPGGLTSLDEPVLAAVARDRAEAAAAPRLLGLAAIVAVAIGFAGGGLPMARPTEQAQLWSPFAPASALAPSTLLDVHP